MRTMAEKAALEPQLKKRSGRKIVMQTLTNKNILSTNIIQLSKHKNIQSVTNYSVVSERQQMEMSSALSELTTGNTQKDALNRRL